MRGIKAGFLKSLFEVNDEERCERYRKLWVKSKELGEKELTDLVKSKLNIETGLFALLALYRKSSNTMLIILHDNRIPFDYALGYVKRFFGQRFFEIGAGAEFEEIRELAALLSRLLEEEAKLRN